MVTQYPHTIVITATPTLTADDDGNLSGGTATDYSYSCRVEPASNNGIIRTENGDEIIYTFVVYMAAITSEFTPGDAVEITLTNGSHYSGTIKRQSNGQLNTRLWV
jgi:hypothetical protein